MPLPPPRGAELSVMAQQYKKGPPDKKNNNFGKTTTQRPDFQPWFFLTKHPMRKIWEAASFKGRKEEKVYLYEAKVYSDILLLSYIFLLFLSKST
jgi:hypothetical protein